MPDYKKYMEIGAEEILEQINKKGTTVLVVTHNREIVNAMQKRVVTMKKGVIVSDEEKARLPFLKSFSKSDCFLGFKYFIL